MILSHAHGENNHASRVRHRVAIALIDRGQIAAFDMATVTFAAQSRVSEARATRVVPRAGWRSPTDGSILGRECRLAALAEVKNFVVAHVRCLLCTSFSVFF